MCIVRGAVHPEQRLASNATGCISYATSHQLLQTSPNSPYYLFLPALCAGVDSNASVAIIVLRGLCADVKEADSFASMAHARMSGLAATTGGVLLLVHVTISPGATSFDAAVMPGHVSSTLLPRTVSAMSALATVTALLPLLVSVAV
jgi:hypothetical protein